MGSAVFKRRQLSKISASIKIQQLELSRRETGQAIYSDLLSVLTTGQQEMESVNLLLNHHSKILSVNHSNHYLIDVGANIGFYTRNFSKRFKFVVSLEPNPRIFALLKMNTSQLDNVWIINKGASNSARSLKLIGRKDHSGGGSVCDKSKLSYLYSIDRSALEEFEIDLIPINDLFKQIKKKILDVKSEIPIIIKIDVEGHELEVIQGISIEKLEEKPALLLELNGTLASRQQVIALCKALGYNLFFTTTDILRAGMKTRAGNASHIFRLGGIRLLINSYLENTVINLKSPQDVSVSQLLAVQHHPKN
jgi:FkbM family methyltransferase